MSQQDDSRSAEMIAPFTRPVGADWTWAPSKHDHDRWWWLPQLIALVPATIGSAVTWLIAALPLGLWATQGCGSGGAPASGTRCPSGHYLDLGMFLYVIPALLWAGCWLLPHGVRWRAPRIALLAVAVVAVIATPLIATYLAFQHMYTVKAV
jgi:hypothetical protein